MHLGIAKARISGIDNEPTYFDHRCFWKIDIIFKKTSTLLFNHLNNIYMGDNFKEAKKYFENFKNNLKSVGIENGTHLEILFDKDNGRVIAFKNIFSDLWIDTSDKFKAKTFKDLNLSIDSLHIHT